MNTPIETDRHVRRVLRHLAPTASDRILEIGCGRGFLTRRIQGHSPETLGIDANPESIRHGVARNLRVMSAARLDFEEAAFDKAYSFHTLEHLPDPGRALDEIARVLRPGGRLLCVVPAEPIRGLFAVPSALRLFGNPLRARELHLHRLTPRRLRRLVETRAIPLDLLTRELDWLLTPQFVTLWERR